MKILCDIGGTHARFGIYYNGKVSAVRKVKAEEFENFQNALEEYCRLQNVRDRPALFIATAAFPDSDNIWRFVNKNKWVIDPASLAEAGWNVEHILNDFEAAAWALADLERSLRVSIKPGDKNTEHPLCLIGPGTGLGLAYYNRGGYVQKTHGGHMIATTVTEEQRDITARVGDMLGIKSAVVFEHLASGPGLVNLYNALTNGEPIQRAEEVIHAIESETGKATLRLFHEFLGLFAHTVVVTGNAYGGLYLTGGMIERLCEHGLFNADQFIKSFTQSGVSSVQAAVRETPVYIITDPNPALLGLQYLCERAS